MYHERSGCQRSIYDMGRFVSDLSSIEKLLSKADKELYAMKAKKKEIQLSKISDGREDIEFVEKPNLGIAS